MILHFSRRLRHVAPSVQQKTDVLIAGGAGIVNLETRDI